MTIDGHCEDAAIGVHFTCRCRISPAVLRFRPRGSGQYALCNIGDARFAVCRVALSSGDGSNTSQHPQVDASVTLRRDSRAFSELQASLLAHKNDTNISDIVQGRELLWISRPAVRTAAAVTLELLSSSKSQLLRDADTRSLLQQTLQRNFVVRAGARVELPTLAGLVARAEAMAFRVVSTYPAAPLVRVTPGTRVTLTEPGKAGKEDGNEIEDSVATGPTAQQDKGVKVGGMEDERAALRELILLPVAHPRLRLELGVEFPKGVLLCGPPGVGKTLLVRSVVHECRQVKDTSGATLDLNLQVINGSEIMTSGRGDAEQALRDTFDAAVAHARSARHAASVIFIDELDALCPKREAAAQLLTLLDGVEGGLSRENVVVAAATNLPNSIDPALRRPGRFDREIFVAPPNTALRKKIFEVHLNRTPYSLSNGSIEEAEQQRDTFLDTLAAKAVGYVGADIAALCREAAMVASTQQLVALSRDRDLEQWWADWKPESSLSAETKLALQQALEWPIKYPQTFARLGVKPPRGVLLYGPPGCSKSSIVRAAAHSSGATFLSLSAAQVFRQAAVRQVFRDARAALPAIIFFDEIDVMVAKREFDGSGGGEGGTSTAMRVLSTMLNEMDGVESAEGLLVIGATNRPACIDAALMRPGRFDRILFVDLPRNLIALPYFSGAELENLCREAALLALRESLDAEEVCMRHLDEALTGITPVSSRESMQDYIEFAEAMGHLS
ncbi:CDC48 domain 2-like [Phytophthora cactorum]|nr:CDC48 domain 2-like [Phytophthora cactorum]